MSSFIVRMLLTAWLLLPVTGLQAISINDPSPAHQHAVFQHLQSLRMKDLQRISGRKFSLKEKIAWQILKWKISHPGGSRLLAKLKKKPSYLNSVKPIDPDEKSAKKGQASLVFGLAGLGLLALIFVIPFMIFPSIISALLAIILGHGATKNKRVDKKGNTGKILGYVTISLIAILFAIALTNFELF